MNKRESIIALYQYIAEVIKSLKTEKKDIHNEEWYYFLENLPKHPGITFNYLDNKNNLSYQKILQVEKLPFLKPLAIDKELLEWISGDWGDYKSSIKLLSEKIVKENNSVKVVNISDEEKEILEKLLKDRQLWIEEQKKIEVVRKLFDVLYSKYLSLDRDSDTLELLVANGIVKVPNEDIYYPVLLKKVNFSLDAERNLITVVDSSDNDFITQELYLNFLAEVENINLDNVFKLVCEVIENKEKPSVPLGERGLDAFGNQPIFEDKGIMERAILGIGTPAASAFEFCSRSTSHIGLVTLPTTLLPCIPKHQKNESRNVRNNTDGSVSATCTIGLITAPTMP